MVNGMWYRKAGKCNIDGKSKIEPPPKKMGQIRKSRPHSEGKEGEDGEAIAELFGNMVT